MHFWLQMGPFKNTSLVPAIWLLQVNIKLIPCYSTHIHACIWYLKFRGAYTQICCLSTKGIKLHHARVALMPGNMKPADPYKRYNSAPIADTVPPPSKSKVRSGVATH